MEANLAKAGTSGAAIYTQQYAETLAFQCPTAFELLPMSLYFQGKMDFDMDSNASTTLSNLHTPSVVAGVVPRCS